MRSNTKSIMFVVSAAFAVAVVAGPAAARGPSDVPRTAAKPSAGAPADAKKVCMQHPALTGSRIARRECRTVAEWQADGYTVTTKAKARAAGQR